MHYSFSFMRASGAQLAELGALYEAGHLRPLIDSTFAFDQTLESTRLRRARQSQGREGRRHTRLKSFA